MVVGGKRGIILSPNRFSGFSGEETVETVRRMGHDVIVTLINQGVDSTFLKKSQVVREGHKNRAIANIFITGVLPITIDDLASGFNIATMASACSKLIRP